jgi:ribonuclease VapC
VTAIVVDASAVIAVYLKEADRDRYHDVLIRTDPVMSCATRLEVAAALLSRRGRSALARVETMMSGYEIRFEPVDFGQTLIALDALARYGRGRREPPAVLNYGDLFAYALAKSRDLPLLYKGGDFGKTDIRSALDEIGSAPP